MKHAEIKTVVQWGKGTDWRLTLQHSCDDHALIWITRGQGIAIIDGVRRGVGVHNALAIPAGTMFSLDLGKTGFGQVCLLPAGGPILMPDSFQHLRIRDVASQNDLTAILEAMQREQSSHRDFMDEALNAQARLLTVWLRRAMIAQGPSERHSSSARLMRAYAALIARDFASGRAMAVYARALGVTPTHLTRVCKQASGLTAAELLTERSLYAARDMLETGTQPIGQIAASLGFGSAAYFSRFILQHTNQTPSALRATAAARKPTVPVL
ncbi:helix-turn-helix transcriptional regulator [Roseovarius sp.]|uniref:helix-turn-helix transcriptional regulator n=1 Tax=Roseovarius sp. TaxID=1486281 RepID=UPI003A96E852